MVEHLNNAIHLSIDMQCMPEKDKLLFLTWRPSGLTLWRIWWSL